MLLMVKIRPCHTFYINCFYFSILKTHTSNASCIAYHSITPVCFDHPSTNPLIPFPIISFVWYPPTGPRERVRRPFDRELHPHDGAGLRHAAVLGHQRRRQAEEAMCFSRVSCRSVNGLKQSIRCIQMLWAINNILSSMFIDLCCWKEIPSVPWLSLILWRDRR